MAVALRTPKKHNGSAASSVASPAPIADAELSLNSEHFAEVTEAVNTILDHHIFHNIINDMPLTMDANAAAEGHEVGFKARPLHEHSASNDIKP